MTADNQREYIESKIRESEERKEITARIHELFEKYTSDKNDEVPEEYFEEIVNKLEKLTLPWVRKYLGTKGCYNEQSEQLILQEARLAVWESILKPREENTQTIEQFAYYSFGTYKHKAQDFVRKMSRTNKHMQPVPIEKGDETGREILPPTKDDYGQSEEKRKLYKYIFLLYLDSLLNSEAFPPRCLALFYARILPHLLSDIPDTKAASAKWALKRMENKSIWQLTQESGKTIKKDVAINMKWGSRYMEQLDDEIQLSGSIWRVRDVIYTLAYNKNKIEDWAEYMHKVTLHIAYKRMLEDKELLELVKDYTTDRVMQKIVKGLEELKV